MNLTVTYAVDQELRKWIRISDVVEHLREHGQS